MARKPRPGNRLRDQQARLQHICPHCGNVAICRSSREMSPLTRELYVQCCNVHCGHTWRALLSIIAIISPSQTPNPGVFVPRSTRKLAEEAAAAADGNQLQLNNLDPWSDHV